MQGCAQRRGWFRGGGTRRRRALVPRRWPTALGSSAKGQGGGTGPYRRLEAAWVAAQTVGDEVPRRVTGGARGGPAAGRLPASGLLGSAPGVPVRETRRSGRSGVLRLCGIAMAEQLTGGGSRVEFRRRRGSDRGKRARRGAWARGETTMQLLEAWGVAEQRGYGGAGCAAWWSNTKAAARVCCGAAGRG